MQRPNRDEMRAVTRETHRLFWEANFVDKWSLFLCYAGRIPAFLLFNVLVPLQVAYGVEAIITRHFENVEGYVWNIVWMSLAYVVLWFIGDTGITRNAVTGSVYLKKKVFANFIHKDYDFFSDAFSGALGSQIIRLRDSYSTYGLLFTLSIPKQAVLIIAGLAIIAYQSLLLAAVTLVAMLAVLSFTIYTAKWRMHHRRELSKVNSEVSGDVGDVLTQAITVKSFAREECEGDRLGTVFEKWRKAQFITWFWSAPTNAGRAFLSSVATVILLLLTARLYAEGTITIAMVTLIQLYVVRLVAATEEISSIMRSYEEVMGAAYHPVQTMTLAAKVVDKEQVRSIPSTAKLDIDFKNVSFHYDIADKDRVAISHFDLTIPQGKKVGLVGYSGSGKTTLTKLLLRFMDVTGGSIRIGGIDIRDVAQKELRARISYVPQEPLLFHRSIFENIAYGNPDAPAEKVYAAAKMARVDEFADELPQKYETLVGERGVKLSGGQRQRVAIARAILRDAPILILDEATSALDSHSERYIQEALRTLMQNRTSLVIAHRLSTIQHLDTIVVMEKGRVVQSGSHQELLKDTSGDYARLWQHQSGGYIKEDDSVE